MQISPLGLKDSQEQVSQEVSCSVCVCVCLFVFEGKDSAEDNPDSYILQFRPNLCSMIMLSLTTFFSPLFDFN